MKTVIMAGGKGTRIASINDEVPKPMIPILGKPILEYQIEALKEQNLNNIIIVVGHLGEKIKDYFGDGTKISQATGEPFGVSITYITETEPLGTAGALYLLKEALKEDFLLINGDIIFDIDVQRFYDFHKKKGAIATLFTHPNSHPYDSGIIVADQKTRVIEWLHKEDQRKWYQNRVNAGIHLLSPKILDQFTELKKVDLDRDILKPLIQERSLFAYDSPEYVKDMGTPDRFYAVEKDIKAGKVKAKNLAQKQKAIFLDRDGTINQYVGFLRNIDDFILVDGAAEAIRKINESGYLAIVVTNQPIIARGEVTINELEKIHQKMETLLGEKGVYLDAVYYCPHHPDKGYKGERPEYKKQCPCRKPNPGMLTEAAKAYNIDLSQSWIIGDGQNDIGAGSSAGCKTVYLGDTKNEQADITASSLLEAVEQIIKKREKPVDLEPKLQKHIDLLIERYPILAHTQQAIIEAYNLMQECYQKNGKLLIAGNGGSAADAEHMVGELMKGFKLKREPDKAFAKRLIETDQSRGEKLSQCLQGGLPAIALTNHPALNSAYLNDVDGELCYAQQVYGYGNEGDVFIGISTSGNAENIRSAATVAKAKKMKVIGFTGKQGGQLAEIADVLVNVPEMETYMVQELHLPIYHCWCLMLEDYFYNN